MSRLDEILDAFDTDDFFANRESIQKAKADLLAWHREEERKKILKELNPEKKYVLIVKDGIRPEDLEKLHDEAPEIKLIVNDGVDLAALEDAIDDIRASLEVSDE